MAPINNYNSNIKDQGLQITIINVIIKKKSLTYCENFQNVTETQSEQMLGNGADRFAHCRQVATKLQFVKDAISAKHNKVKHITMRYPCI